MVGKHTKGGVLRGGREGYPTTVDTCDRGLCRTSPGANNSLRLQLESKKTRDAYPHKPLCDLVIVYRPQNRQYCQAYITRRRVHQYEYGHVFARVPQLAILHFGHIPHPSSKSFVMLTTISFYTPPLPVKYQRGYS